MARTSRTFRTAGISGAWGGDHDGQRGVAAGSGDFVIATIPASTAIDHEEVFDITEARGRSPREDITEGFGNVPRTQCASVGFA